MSWAEVKKAINSNINEPLDVLIKRESRSGVYGLQTAKGKDTLAASDKYKILLNITGKGYLGNVLCMCNLDGGSQHSNILYFKLIIDDKDVLVLKFTPTMSTASYDLFITTGIANLKSGVVTSDGFNPFGNWSSSEDYNELCSIDINGFHGYGGDTKRFGKLIKFSPDQQIFENSVSNTTMYSTPIVLMDELIRFEKNVKLQVGNDNVKSLPYKYLVTYMLDE